MAILMSTFVQSRVTDLNHPTQPPTQPDLDTKTLSHKTALALFHHHETVIRLNPVVTHLAPIPASHKSAVPITQLCELFSISDPNPETWSHYTITDRLPTPVISNFSSKATSDVVYTAALRATEHGVESLVQAPAGVTLHGTWTVHRKEDGSGLEVIERTTARCSVLLAWYVKTDLERSHIGLHARMKEEWERRMGEVLVAEEPTEEAGEA